MINLNFWKPKKTFRTKKITNFVFLQASEQICSKCKDWGINCGKSTELCTRNRILVSCLRLLSDIPIVEELLVT